MAFTITDSAGQVLTAITFPQIGKGQSTQILQIQLWNEKDNPSGAIATGIRLGIGANDPNMFMEGVGNINGEELVKEKWIQARSNGVVDPGNVGIVDDAMTVFVPIGGDPNIDPTNFLQIGDMPPNTARIIELILTVPANAESDGVVSFQLFVDKDAS